jgi:hypothetical protein
MTDVTITGSEERSLTGIESALARNRAFAAAGGHEGASLLFLAWACLSSRASTRASTPRMSSASSSATRS